MPSGYAAPYHTAGLLQDADNGTVISFLKREDKTICGSVWVCFGLSSVAMALPSSYSDDVRLLNCVCDAFRLAASIPDTWLDDVNDLTRMLSLGRDVLYPSAYEIYLKGSELDCCYDKSLPAPMTREEWFDGYGFLKEKLRSSVAGWVG